MNDIIEARTNSQKQTSNLTSQRQYFTGQEAAPFGSFFGGIGMLKHQRKHSLGRILNRNADWS